MEAKYIYAGGVYSDIVILDGQLYLSGVVSQDLATGEMLTGDIELETEQVLKNIQSILEANGSGMDKIIRVEIYLTEFSERDRMNEVYIRHFSGEKVPARICVGTTALAEGAKVEMMVNAYL